MMIARKILFLQKKFQPRRTCQGITFSYSMRRDILHCFLQNSASMKGSFSQYWRFVLTWKFMSSFFAALLWEKFPKCFSPLKQSTLLRISFSFWFKYRVPPFICCRKPSFRYSVLFQANGYPGLLSIARTICLLICARIV